MKDRPMTESEKKKRQQQWQWRPSNIRFYANQLAKILFLILKNLFLLKEIPDHISNTPMFEQNQFLAKAREEGIQSKINKEELAHHQLKKCSTNFQRWLSGPRNEYCPPLYCHISY
jgi:hypothetical protein